MNTYGSIIDVQRFFQRAIRALTCMIHVLWEVSTLKESTNIFIQRISEMFFFYTIPIRFIAFISFSPYTAELSFHSIAGDQIIQFIFLVSLFYIKILVTF